MTDGANELAGQYKAVFDVIEEGACIIERLQRSTGGLRDYRYVAMNPAMQKMFGVADLTGQSIRESFPDEVEDWYDDYDRVLDTGKSIRFNRESLPQGMVIEMFVCRLHDFPGRLLAVMKNVSHEQRDREALRRSEEQYRTLFESIDDGFCTIEVIFDEAGTATDYRFLQANPAFEQQTGLTDAVGKSMRELAPGHESHWFEIYGKIARTGKSMRFEDKAEALGRWYEVYAFRVGDPDDRQVAVLFRDILPKKRAETALRASEERARALVNASSDVIYRMSADWTEMQQLDGRGFLADIDSPAIKWMDEFILPEDHDMVQAAIDKAVDSRGVFKLEHRVRRADGTIGWTFSRAVPVFGEGGDIVDWFGMATDITARRRSEERRELMNRELSHRLKNVLAVVSSVAAQTLRSSPDMRTAQRALSERIGNMARAQDILVRGHRDAAPIRDIVEAATSVHAERERIHASGPDVTLGPNAALSLSLIIHELSTNAIKYGSLSVPGGRVDVTWDVKPGRGSEPAVFEFDWREAGGPKVTAPEKVGFGSRLIQIGLGRDEHSEVSLDYAEDGLRCTIAAPLHLLQTDEEEV